jgi:predicted heme/steroid binding protein
VYRMKEFSKEELAHYNGKNGAPAYIGYKGNVYDVSGSSLWRIGDHLHSWVFELRKERRDG